MNTKTRRRNRRPPDNVMAGTAFNPVPGYAGLFVDKSGTRVLSVCELRQTMHRDGYLRIQVNQDIGDEYRKARPGVHQLVALAFLPPRQAGENQVRHRNGKRTDNRSRNLAWGCGKSNGKDKADHGSSKGRKNGRVKLSEESVREIRRMIGSCHVRSIAARFGVSESTVDAIKTGRNWGWLK